MKYRYTIFVKSPSFPVIRDVIAKLKEMGYRTMEIGTFLNYWVPIAEVKMETKRKMSEGDHRAAETLIQEEILRFFGTEGLEVTVERVRARHAGWRLP